MYLLNVGSNGSFGVKIQSLDTLNVVLFLLTLWRGEEKDEGGRWRGKRRGRGRRRREEVFGVNWRLVDQHCRQKPEADLIWRFPGDSSCISCSLHFESKFIF